MTKDAEPAPSESVYGAEARHLFSVIVRDLDAGKPVDLEALCAAHPLLAPELHMLHAHYQRVRGAFDTFDETVHTNEGLGHTFASLLERLRSRRPSVDRYTMRGPIARGGMGYVHHVYDEVLKRSLAMKVMRCGEDGADSNADMDERTLSRFLEEAQVTGQLDHPGIVPVHELGVDESEKPYFTMKLVRGGTLSSVFDKVHAGSDDWNPTRALGVLLRVCEAMAFAHRKGVLHRDLKPANIMVGNYGEVYVMDWGIARVLGEEDRRDTRLRRPPETSAVLSDRRRLGKSTPDEPLVTMDGDVVGTPVYMAPEQAEGRLAELGPWSDVYSVGAMLYHLLAGHPPYARPRTRLSPHTILAMVIQAGPDPIHEEAPDAPAELHAICDKAMARRIEDRYPDMLSLARDLRAFLEQRVVAAYESGAWAELRKWVARNQALAATAAAALLAVLALSGWALVERSKADRQAALATARADDAERERARADARADDVMRLSDARRLSEVKSELHDLWPPYPEKLPAMAQWLRDAHALLSKLPVHKAKLRELRAAGTPLPLDPPSPEIVAKESDLARLREARERGVADAEPGAGRYERIATLEAELAAQRAVDDSRRELARGYAFRDDDGTSPSTRLCGRDALWWHDALRDLVIELEGLQADDRFKDTLANVEWRQQIASTLRERTVDGDEAARDWAVARQAVGSHPHYGGLDLPPQIGLLPLEPDPESGLWEFWHVLSGARPVRDARSGRWIVSDDTGIILVLIPPGTYTLGAQAEDPDGPYFDPDAQSQRVEVLHDVTLPAYFLAKYEMTQGQWMRLSGTNPSAIFAKYPSASGGIIRSTTFSGPSAPSCCGALA